MKIQSWRLVMTDRGRYGILILGRKSELTNARRIVASSISCKAD